MVIGPGFFIICTHCTRMRSHNQLCPECGSPLYREYRDTTPEERRRWEAKLYFGDPSKEKINDEVDEIIVRGGIALSWRWGAHQKDFYGRQKLHTMMLEALKVNEKVFDDEAAAGGSVESYRRTNARAQGTIYGQMFRCRELVREGYVSKLKGAQEPTSS